MSVSQVALSTPKEEGSLENLGGGEFMRKNYVTPPKVKQEQRIIDKLSEIKPPNRKSGGPVDDWEAKLFGKQPNFDNKNGTLIIQF